VNLPQIKLVSTYSPDDYLVCIVEKNCCDQLSSLLTTQEYAFFNQGLSNKVKQYLFPRGLSAVVIKVLPSKISQHERDEAARQAGSDIVALCNQNKIRNISLAAFADYAIGLPFLEGLLLGNYAFTKYFTKPEKRRLRIEQINVLESVTSQPELTELMHLMDAVYTTRSLVNEPFGTLDTVHLHDQIKELTKACGIALETLGLEQMQAMRMGGILAVNQASKKPPHFHILEWKPTNAKNSKPLVLVGKGVVFDTGGLSLKAADGLEAMKYDMAGAATVIGTITALAKNKLPVHVIGLIPATDNLVSETAIVPGDVIRMFSGTTVEVVNTDAEGRLILADALHYATKLNPDLVIDFATLTGAAIRALGNHAICYMGTANKEVKTSLEDSGWQTFERLVEFPLWSEYGDDLKSNIADLKNLGGNYAGMITAGKFLEHFIDYPWLHLDIAGPAWLKTAQGYRPKDATGVGVRLMYRFIKDQYCQ
jgi:leucyl aminopeptidase